MAVSPSGSVVFTKRKKYAMGRQHRSLHLFDTNTDQFVTIIPEGANRIYGIASLTILGEDYIIFCRDTKIMLLDMKYGTEKTLLKLKRHTTIYPTSSNSILYVQPHGSKGKGLELRELTVSLRENQDTYKALIPLEWETVRDMCQNFEMLVLCSHKDNSVAAVQSGDWQIRWKVMIEDPRSVCFDTRGRLYIACCHQNAVKQLSPLDGSVMIHLPLVPAVIRPMSLCYHNDRLYVAHINAKNEEQWNISQYILE